jgi:peptidoglycan/LPS O-acetylase OafA/YrhL
MCAASVDRGAGAPVLTSFVRGGPVSADVRGAGSEQSTAAPRGEIRALTGLRAVAASVVVLFHLQGFGGMYLDQVPLVRVLVSVGWTGVELFFVLSGFVLTLGYLDRVGRRPTPRVVGTFVFNRFARVWPSWAVVTVVMAGWLWVLRTRGWDPDVVTAHPVTDLPTLVRQLSMTQMWDQSDVLGASYVLPGWSISAEWAAYLSFPLLAVVLRPLRRLPAPVLLGLAVVAMSPLAVTAYAIGTPDHAQPWALRITCGFLAGMLTALAVRRLRATPRADSVALAGSWTCLCLVLAGASWAWWMRGQDPGHDHGGVVVVVFPLLVATLCLTRRGPARWLSSAPLNYAGRLSYCMYLVHFVVIDVLVTLWWRTPAERWVVTPGLALALPAVVLVSALASAVLHHGVEEPTRKSLTALVRPRRTAAAGEGATVTRLQPRPAASAGATVVPAPVSRRTAGDPLPPTSQIPAAAVRNRLLIAVPRATTTSAARVDSSSA